MAKVEQAKCLITLKTGSIFMKSFIRYAWYADSPTKEQCQNHPKWAIIPDTEKGIQTALTNGFTAISTTAFSNEPKSKKPEPIRKGSLILDIDCKEDQAKAIVATQQFIGKFCLQYSVDAHSLRYWMSGGKGCHIEIPAEIFGAEEGDSHLPKIYKYTLEMILSDRNMCDVKEYFDFSMFCMGKGKLLRQENILRPNDRYKVPVTANEFLTMEPNELIGLTHSPRELPQETQAHQAKRSEMLVELYEYVKATYSSSKQFKYPITAIESLMDCDFMKHCKENAQTLSEPEWFAMIRLLSPLKGLGSFFIHRLSAAYPEYSRDKTEQKYMQALDAGHKAYITCNYIRSLFPCTKQCAVSSPCDLLKLQKIQESQAASIYISNDDGLFYMPESGGMEKICSPLKVLHKTCLSDKLGWGRLVSIRNHYGDKELELSMRDFVRPDLILGPLLDAGLEIVNYQLAKKHIHAYIMSAAQSEGVKIMIRQLGWCQDNYVLPDHIYGNGVDIVFQPNGLENVHQAAMEMKDWQEQIGLLCKGNSLLVLVTAMALAGPLLRPCDCEGIGLNIFGPSSSGKTTAALVAGSVCGGGGRNGYVRSWRSTDNALEAIAAMHNDGLLILDEISQAPSKTVGHTVYMLFNGEAKSRMTADASLRKTAQWKLNLLSTGELTVPDKIREGGYAKPMAGQEVRVIDLPVDAGRGDSLYETMHGYSDGAQLSNALVDRAKQFYGIPLRTFLECLCKDKDTYVERIVQGLDVFVAEHCPSGASGQVQRVCRKFGLLATTGELAIEFGVLPYEEGECTKAAVRWFNIWLDQRQGIGNLEIENAIKAIDETIALEGETLFTDISSNNTSHLPRGYLGYRCKEDRQFVYFLLAPHFSRLCGNANKVAVETELKKRGLVKLTNSGEIMRTKSVNDKNHRGIGILVPLDRVIAHITQEIYPIAPASTLAELSTDLSF